MHSFLHFDCLRSSYWYKLSFLRIHHLHTCNFATKFPTLQTETVGSPVDRNCPLVMLTHYNICPMAAHGLFSGQELPTYFQSHFNIWPWAAHWQLGLLYHIVASSVDGSNFDTEKAVGNGQLQHRCFTMPVNNDCTIVDIQCIMGR